MNAKLLAGALGAVLLLAPITFGQDERNGKMSEDMRQAIEFQRAKDRADARQARLEASGSGASSADRSAEAPKAKHKAKNYKPAAEPSTK